MTSRYGVFTHKAVCNVGGILGADGYRDGSSCRLSSGGAPDFRKFALEFLLEEHDTEPHEVHALAQDELEVARPRATERMTSCRG
jgi:hypothetical protein